MRTPTPSGEKFDTTQEWCPHCSGDRSLQRHCTHADVVQIDCPEPGSIIASDYEFISLLGSGGMGVVYKCKNIHLDRVVAVKMLIARRYGQEDVVRFQKEARAAGKFKHPNLVSVLDFGIADDAEPFMVMEYLEGVTLDKLIEQNNVSIADLISIFIHCCTGLAYAHQQGVLHRDLKPSNIMIADFEGDSIVKILDFGIAKIADAGRFEHTVTGKGFFGTPSYMSPEQGLGHVLTNRCDVYSMGCVMYEAMTGHRPFEAGSVLELINLHQTKSPPLIGERAPDRSFPEDLEGLISSMLLKDPESRPGMKEVAEELIRIQEEERIEKLKAEALADGVSPPDPKPVKNKDIWLLKRAIGLFCVLVLVLGLVLISNLKIQNQTKPQVHLHTEHDLVDSIGTLTDDDEFMITQMRNQLLNTELSFNDVTLSPKSLKELATKAKNCHSLRFINCPEMTAKNLEILRDRNLTSIVIRGPHLNDEGLEVLSTFHTLNAIRLEEVSTIDSAGIALLKKLPNLRTLAIRNMPVDKQTIKACSEMNLAMLELSIIRDLDNSALAYLTKSSSLSEVVLNDSNFTDTGLELVSKIPNLSLLLANGTKITDRGFSALNKTKHLRGLSISYCRGITDHSVSVLVSLFARSPDQTGSEYRLDHTGITSASIPQLKKLKGISKIDLSGLKGFDQHLIADLRKALPKTHVEYSSETKEGSGNRERAWREIIEQK